jgi:hypothetical protein
MLFVVWDWHKDSYVMVILHKDQPNRNPVQMSGHSTRRPNMCKQKKKFHAYVEMYQDFTTRMTFFLLLQL